MEDKKFTARVVNQKRGDHGGHIRIGRVEPEKPDQQVAGSRAEEKGHGGDRIKEKQFVMTFVLTRLEDKQDVEDVRREIGKEEAEHFVDPVVPEANCFRNRANIQIPKAEQFGKGVACGQGRENQPGKKEKDNHIHDGGDTAAHAVFNELQDGVFLVG